eukprot:CAMPEP_0173388536 /NCGR_PEP_ID=MMETSP1356-20130122/10818_1 /TAXON_ID=77927 ORGANISM="Hemiselmis virescens, Strain PCC157" /NCGR_SAMPLE_ID=MMETSP1356 /ASSEMBLY_ACC=CAM_ASM_000847 /LENGTH=388 /DNA_ID=CAMNT_0014345469 /DNA_START=54 /DNA_END=1220 /DNA_ORIENTATION=-
MRTATRLLVAALVVAAVVAQPTGDQGRGKEKNQNGEEVQRTPRPAAQNKEAVKGGRPAPTVDRQGDKGSKMFVLQSNGFNVEVNAASPTPFFRFWSDVNNMQMVKLDRMFQTSTPDALASSGPIKTVKLQGAYAWTFEDTTSTVDANTNTTDVSFTVTGAARSPGNANRPTPGIVFTCHLLSNANGTEMKFDVDITNWEATWWGDNAQALVIGYKVSAVNANKEDIGNLTMSDVRIQKDAKRPNRPTTTGDASATKEKVAMDFGNGNGFEIVAEATETGGAAKWAKMTAISTPNGGTYVLTMYEKFAGGLRHDPSLYTASTSGTVDPAASTTFDSAPPISIGEDTGIPPGGTPPPGDTIDTGAASAVRSLTGFTALLAMAVAAMAGRF